MKGEFMKMPWHSRHEPRPSGVLFVTDGGNRIENLTIHAVSPGAMEFMGIEFKEPSNNTFKDIRCGR